MSKNGPNRFVDSAFLSVSEELAGIINQQSFSIVPEGSSPLAVATQWINCVCEDSLSFFGLDTLGKTRIIKFLKQATKTKSIDDMKEIISKISPRRSSFDVPFYYHGKSSFSFIDLFAGIGGIRIGATEAGGCCVFSSEFEPHAQETYFANFHEYPFGDITKIDPCDVPNHDLLLAGFPCQPFSNAGLKKGVEDTRGTLFYNIAKIIKEKRPKAVLLENVRGLVSNNEGKTFQTILQAITGLGFSCNIEQRIIDDGPISVLQKEASKMILCSKDYGIPQNRPRLYIVLWNNELCPIKHFSYPKPCGQETHVRDILEKDVASTYTISNKLWEGHKRRRKENTLKGNGFGYCLFNGDSPYTSTLSRRYYKDGSEILIEQSK